MVKITEHDQAATITRGIHHRLEVADDHSVEVDIEQIFAAERSFGIEQLHLRPPTDEVCILQGDSFDPLDARQVRHAYRVGRQLVMQEMCLHDSVFHARAQHANDFHTNP